MEKDKDALQYPVTVAGQEYKKLTMRRPKVKDDLAAQAQAKSEGEREAFLFAILTGVPPEVIRELDQAADYARLQEEYQGFFTSTPTTSDSPGRS
jgi:hypothetical protein